MGIEIKHEGDTWKILGQGVSRDGKVLCHLASTTRFRQQKNGPCPIQMMDWIEHERILSAHMQAEEEQRRQAAITSYYEDRANSGQSALEARP